MQSRGVIRGGDGDIAGRTECRTLDGKDRALRDVLGGRSTVEYRCDGQLREGGACEGGEQDKNLFPE